MRFTYKLGALLTISMLLFACVKPTTTTDEKTDSAEQLQENVEYFILQKYNPNHHTTRNIGELKKYDIVELFNNNYAPYEFAHEEYAHEMNKEAFAFIANYSKENEIAYTLRYDYLTKENEEDPWNGHWTIILFDKDKNILEDINIMP